MSDVDDRVAAEFRVDGGPTEVSGDHLVVLHTIGAESGDGRLGPHGRPGAR